MKINKIQINLKKRLLEKNLNKIQLKDQVNSIVIF